SAPEQTREQVLQAMRRTNYAAVTPDMLDTLFRQVYLERLTGEQRLSMVTMVDVEAAEMVDGEIVLTLNDRMRACRDELRCDLVLLGTGFEGRPPSLVRDLADSLISVLAVRAGEIVSDLLAHREGTDPRSDADSALMWA